MWCSATVPMAIGPADCLTRTWCSCLGHSHTYWAVANHSDVSSLSSSGKARRKAHAHEERAISRYHERRDTMDQSTSASLNRYYHQAGRGEGHAGGRERYGAQCTAKTMPGAL